MTNITWETEIAAPIERCFDLWIDPENRRATVFQRLMRELNDPIDQPGHLRLEILHAAGPSGKKLKADYEVIKVEPPTRFVERMKKGPFYECVHEHLFQEIEGGTLLTERVLIVNGVDIYQRQIEPVLLNSSVTRLMAERNDELAEIAESA